MDLTPTAIDFLNERLPPGFLVEIIGSEHLIQDARAERNTLVREDLSVEMQEKKTDLESCSVASSRQDYNTMLSILSKLKRHSAYKRCRLEEESMSFAGFQAIERKVQRREYQHRKDFVRDVASMFSVVTVNCPPLSDLYDASIDLSQYFQLIVSDTDGPPISLKKRLKGPRPPANSYLSDSEKRSLVNKIRGLDERYQAGIVDIVRELTGLEVDSTASEIDFEALPLAAVRGLIEYVEFCEKKQACATLRTPAPQPASQPVASHEQQSAAVSTIPTISATTKLRPTELPHLPRLLR